MPRTYTKANAETVSVMKAMLAKYHGDLKDTGIEIGVLLAYGPRNNDGDLTSPAIVERKRPCYGKVKITKLDDRVLGAPDAVIYLDGDQIDDWTEQFASAVIDHELEHLEVKTDKDGAVSFDDVGRPELKMREHEVEVGWFPNVARRHGEHSVEAQQARDIVAEYSEQLLLPGFE